MNGFDPKFKDFPDYFIGIIKMNGETGLLHDKSGFETDMITQSSATTPSMHGKAALYHITSTFDPAGATWQP